MSSMNNELRVHANLETRNIEMLTPQKLHNINSPNTDNTDQSTSIGSIHPNDSQDVGNRSHGTLSSHKLVCVDEMSPALDEGKIAFDHGLVDNSMGHLRTDEGLHSGHSGVDLIRPPSLVGGDVDDGCWLPPQPDSYDRKANYLPNLCTTPTPVSKPLDVQETAALQQVLIAGQQQGNLPGALRQFQLHNTSGNSNFLGAIAAQPNINKIQDWPCLLEMEEVLNRIQRAEPISHLQTNPLGASNPMVWEQIAKAFPNLEARSGKADKLEKIDEQRTEWKTASPYEDPNKLRQYLWGDEKLLPFMLLGAAGAAAEASQQAVPNLAPNQSPLLGASLMSNVAVPPLLAVPNVTNLLASSAGPANAQAPLLPGPLLGQPPPVGNQGNAATLNAAQGLDNSELAGLNYANQILMAGSKFPEPWVDPTLSAPATKFWSACHEMYKNSSEHLAMDFWTWLMHTVGLATLNQLKQNDRPKEEPSPKRPPLISVPPVVSNPGMVPMSFGAPYWARTPTYSPAYDPNTVPMAMQGMQVGMQPMQSMFKSPQMNEEEVYEKTLPDISRLYKDISTESRPLIEENMQRMEYDSMNQGYGMDRSPEVQGSDMHAESDRWNALPISPVRRWNRDEQTPDMLSPYRGSNFKEHLPPPVNVGWTGGPSLLPRMQSSDSHSNRAQTFKTPSTLSAQEKAILDSMYDEAAEKDPEILEVKGKVLELCRIQSGSRYLQKLLCKGNRYPEFVHVILKEIEPDIASLMTDAYGNYMCQQLFGSCGIPQRRTMLERLAPKAYDIAKDRRGTHALQALISLLSTAEEERILTQHLSNHVLDLSMDSNGTHVLQRILVCFKHIKCDFIYVPITEALSQVAQNAFGLCVVKKCISQVTDGPLQMKMIEQMTQNAIELVQSAYGNYAIQHAIESWGGEICRPILLQLRGRIRVLSTQKFSSNVVEKCLEEASPELRHNFILELVAMEESNILVQSSYGNYVVAKALELATPEESQMIHASVQEALKQVTNKRLRSKWERTLEGKICRRGSDESPNSPEPLQRERV